MKYDKLSAHIYCILLIQNYKLNFQGSSDSGKGCSEAASPPPANINTVPSETELRIHQFVIPQSLVGLLIGKQGSFVTQIKAKTGASVYVRRHPDSLKQKICAVEGRN